ncbi:MAG: M15 family metallopeptidase [Candidatus Gracilibacteria bacterium]|nr:M15 family metallopeptidase [Candidatus Gracilibacteria bacterium]
MKNFLKIKLFKHTSRVRVYFYMISAFIIVLLLYFIFVVHYSRNFINTKIYYYYPDHYSSGIIQGGTLLSDDKFDNNYDFDTDSSFTKFVNNKVGFNKIDYIPDDLEKIESDYVLDIRGDSLYRKDANLALQNMAKDFYLIFKKKMVVVSAFRSYEYQVGIKSRGCSDLFCAKPGFSEHQTGLVLDLWEASTEKEFLSNKMLNAYYSWMQDNAYKYGFHNTYQKGPDVDGYVVEPWHWRYLGIDFATYLYENKLTISEFYQKYTENK